MSKKVKDLDLERQLNSDISGDFEQDHKDLANIAASGPIRLQQKGHQSVRNGSIPLPGEINNSQSNQSLNGAGSATHQAFESSPQHNQAKHHTTQNGSNISYIGHNKKNFSGLYFRVKFPQELDQLGRHIQELMNKGNCNFGLCSLSSKRAFLDSIIGIAAYLEHTKEHKVALILDFQDPEVEAFFNGFGLRSNMQMEHLQLSNSESAISYRSLGDYVDLWDIGTITSLDAHSNFDSNKYSNWVGDIFSLYRSVIVDVSHIDKISQSSKKYFPIISKLDSIDYFTEPRVGKFKKINKAMNYFEKYNIEHSAMVIKE